MDMALTGRNIQARKAKSIGLVDQLIEPLGKKSESFYRFNFQICKICRPRFEISRTGYVRIFGTSGR